MLGSLVGDSGSQSADQLEFEIREQLCLVPPKFAKTAVKIFTAVNLLIPILLEVFV